MKAAKNKNTVVIGGAEEVVCLGFMLDIGDVKKPVDSSYRKELLYSMLSQNLYGSSLAWKEELKQVGDVYVNELHRLMKFLEDGEAIRICYSDVPYSRCGFYSLCRIVSLQPPEEVRAGHNIKNTVNQGFRRTPRKPFSCQCIFTPHAL